MNNEQQKAASELQKAMQCLYFELHESIADDVKLKGEAVIHELEQVQRERDDLRARLLTYRETATYIIANFQELNGSECVRRCGTCIKCRLEALL